MQKKDSLRRRRRMETWMDIFFVAPQFILYFGLTILPFFVALPIILTDRLSFVDETVHFVWFQNFVNIFRKPVADEFIPAVIRSAVFTIVNYGTVWLFGMTLALLMYELTSRVRRGFFTVIYMPYMVSGLGIGMMLIMLFSRDTGSANLILLRLGLLEKALNIKDPTVSTFALPLLVGWRYAGFNMALFLSGLLSIPTDTIDAARVDGVNYRQRFRHIYLPQMIPSIIIASILCLIGSFGLFDEPMGMGATYGNQSVQFLSIVIYRFSFGSHQAGHAGTLAEAMTMSVTVYLPLFVAAYFLTRLQKRLQY